MPRISSPPTLAGFIADLEQEIERLELEDPSSAELPLIRRDLVDIKRFGVSRHDPVAQRVTSGSRTG
jgi:hypothetical protein